MDQRPKETKVPKESLLKIKLEQAKEFYETIMNHYTMAFDNFRTKLIVIDEDFSKLSKEHVYFEFLFKTDQIIIEPKYSDDFVHLVYTYNGCSILIND